MARFPFFERVNVAEHVKQLTLSGYTPEIKLEGLLTGVDNLRHDVYLSPKFSDVARGYLQKVIAKYGAAGKTENSTIEIQNKQKGFKRI